MGYDDVFEYVGDFGFRQKKIAVLCLIPGAIAIAQLMAINFLIAAPAFRCYDPGMDSDDGSIVSNSSWGLPEEVTDDYARCQLSDINITSSIGRNASSAQCDRFVYDRSQYRNSIAMDWNLVCGKSWLANLAISMTEVGALIGGIVLGKTANKFGRKKTLVGSMVLLLLAGVGLAFVPEYWSFLATRTVLGIGIVGATSVNVVLAMEVSGPSGRTVVGCLGQLFNHSIGFPFAAVMGHFIRDWRMLQLALSAPVLPLLLVTLCCVPESDRWLIQTNQIEKAKKSIRRASLQNDNPISEVYLEKVTQSPTGQAAVMGSTLDLLMYGPRLRRTTLIILQDWFVVLGSFFGLSFNTSSLPIGSDYLNLAVSGLTMIPACVICLLLERFGRRLQLCTGQLFAGVCLLAMAFVPSDMTLCIYILATVGKLSLSVSLIVMVNMTVELFPTAVRSLGMGVAQVVGKIGSLVAPFVLLLGNSVHPAIPAAVFGSTCLLGSFACFFLPETHGQPLPETLQDGENLGLEGPKTTQHSHAENENTLEMTSTKHGVDMNGDSADLNITSEGGELPSTGASGTCDVRVEIHDVSTASPQVGIDNSGYISEEGSHINGQSGTVSGVETPENGVNF